jgi:hypothetical protein
MERRLPPPYRQGRTPCCPCTGHSPCHPSPPRLRSCLHPPPSRPQVPRYLAQELHVSWLW